MANLGRLQKCLDLTVYRVDSKPIPPGSRLRRYYIHRYAKLITQMQSVIEEGSSSLARFLSAREWQHIDFTDNAVGIEADAMKMMVVLEAIFEYTRTKLTSHLPSRLNCVFVWPTLELSKQFRHDYIPDGVIHRCCITQGDVVRLDGALLPPGIDLSNLSDEVFAAEFLATQLRAEKYWIAQEPPKLTELLVVGNVEIVEINADH